MYVMCLAHGENSVSVDYFFIHLFNKHWRPNWKHFMDGETEAEESGVIIQLLLR